MLFMEREKRQQNPSEGYTFKDNKKRLIYSSWHFHYKLIHKSLCMCVQLRIDPAYA